MIDNIITNTLLPALSREFLRRSIAKEELKEARVAIENGGFAYAGSSAIPEKWMPVFREADMRRRKDLTPRRKINRRRGPAGKPLPASA